MLENLRIMRNMLRRLNQPCFIEINGDPSRKARTKHNQWVAVTNSAIGNQRPQRAPEGCD
jgi:hypothetical protein